ncbi:putative ribonuclease H-like domain-containing protein [Tanacetum coccineum]
MCVLAHVTGTQGELNAGTSTQKEEISQDWIVMPIWKDASYFDSPSKDVGNGEPKSAADDQKQVEDGPHNESVEKIMNTASSYDPDSPKDMFKLGASHTLEATHVEFFSDEDEPEVDLGNITNSYTVPTTPNTRIHKDHPIKNVIGDTEPTRIAKALSDSSWVEAMPKNFCNSSSNRGKIDQIFFIKKQKGDILLVQVYVDDIIFGSTNKELCTAFKKLMKDKFQMSSMGELTFFLGLQVTQKEDGIFISQDKYVAEILKKFNYTDVKSASTPVDLEKALVKDGDADDVYAHLYRSMMGSLMYLTASRPNIMFAVCACARFQVTPKTSHLLAVKRIFRYLKGNPTLGLWYSRDYPFELVAYTDSDYARATQDRKSTTGGYQFLGNRLISWQCKKQTVVATSTTEAEYVAASSCCGQVGDEAVHKELGDRMERATTTASSLEAEQDSEKKNTVNGECQLQALIDKKRVIITESSIRIDLHLADAGGIDCLSTDTIFEELARMGYEKPSQRLVFYKAFFSLQWKFLIHTITQCLSAKSTAWNKFSSTMASAIICLATNQIFNLSKYIFDAMVKHLEGGVKFLMYPRFVQVFLNNQLGDMSHHKKIYVNPLHTKKIFANMKRQGKDFSGRVTPLFAIMMVQATQDEGVDSGIHTDSQHTPITTQPSSFRP